jgi:hypothetical protein
MSTLKGIGFGRFFCGFAAVAAMAGAMGCASSGGLEGRDALGVAMAQGAQASAQGSLSAGAPRVVDSHVNPLVPVRLTAEDGGLAVRFARARSGGAVAHLDGTSLAPSAPAAETTPAVGLASGQPAERAAAPSTEPARAVFDDGRFIVCWKSGDAERGYRVMAQAWSGGGESLGAPVAISPVDSDVLGAPQVVAMGADHAVATFAAVDGSRTQLLAVSLQVLGVL